MTPRHLLTRLSTAIQRTVVRKNKYATIPKGHMGCDQYTVLVAVAVELTFVAFLSTRKHTSMAARAIRFNFLEELRERPQYLSGLSRVRFSHNLS